MPIFEYQCQGCGHIFEKVLLARNGAEMPTCPGCQAIQTRQLMSRFSALSSGTGSVACAPSGFS
jgi:putative FmdB family regulatory protein